MTRRNIIYLMLVFTVLFFVNSAYPQQEKKITIEWANSDECKKLMELPQYTWLEDGSAYIFDSAKDPNERTIERLDPRTGKRKSAVNKEKALESLEKLLNKDTPKRLSWPASFDKIGKYAQYEFDNDIFLLDMDKAQFRRITNTDSTEKAIRFSPDGKKIAYVCDNDLYVYTIENEKEKRITEDGSDTTLNGTLSYVYWEEIFGREDYGYWWSEDSDSIAYLKTDESCVPIAYFVDYKPQTPRLLTQRYPKAGQQNPIVRLCITDVNGSQISQLDSSEIPYEYIARVKWLPDNERLCVETLNRNQNKLDIYFMDKDSGKTKLIFTERDSGWVEMTDDLVFFKDGSTSSGFRAGMALHICFYIQWKVSLFARLQRANGRSVQSAAGLSGS